MTQLSNSTVPQVKTRINDDQAIEIRSELEKRQIAIRQFSMYYSPSKKGAILAEGIGPSGIPQHEDYFENIEQNVLFTDCNWYSEFCEIFKDLYIDTHINVLPDGNFDHNNIRIELKASVTGHKKHEILHNIFPVFGKLMPYKQHITNVEFGGNNHFLRKISVLMEIDSKKLNLLVKEKAVNKQMLNQWMGTVEHVIKYNEGRYKFIHDVPVVNGRMNIINSEPTVCFLVEQKSGGRG